MIDLDRRFLDPIPRMNQKPVSHMKLSYGAATSLDVQKKRYNEYISTTWKGCLSLKSGIVSI